jgi:hypothetical protein
LIVQLWHIFTFNIRDGELDKLPNGNTALKAMGMVS